jgi:hypothetical protein
LEHKGFGVFWRVAPWSTHEGGVPNPFPCSRYNASKSLRIESLHVESTNVIKYLQYFGVIARFKLIPKFVFLVFLVLVILVIISECEVFGGR